MAAVLVGPDYKYTAVWTPINMQLGEYPALHCKHLCRSHNEGCHEHMVQAHCLQIKSGACGHAVQALARCIRRSSRQTY